MGHTVHQNLIFAVEEIPKLPGLVGFYIHQKRGVKCAKINS